MRKLKYTVSRNALNQIYLYHLQPIIECASLVWDGCTQQDSNTLQKIQNEAVRIVTGLTRSVSLLTLYKERGWTNLSVGRHQQKLYFLHKANNGMVPTYIADLIPPLVSEISGYPLKNDNILLHQSLEQIFQQDHVYRQLSECGKTLMKVLKPKQQYHLSSTIYKPLLFEKNAST